MVYLPQVVFKHILSFKDPRYERVMDGNPYMATPTRVFVITSKDYRRYKVPKLTRSEFQRTDSDSEGPDEFPKILHCVKYYRDSERNLSLRCVDRIDDREAMLRPRLYYLFLDQPIYYHDPNATVKCSYKATEMSMQCEACGPDLELYQRR